MLTPSAPLELAEEVRIVVGTGDAWWRPRRPRPRATAGGAQLTLVQEPDDRPDYERDGGDREQDLEHSPNVVVASYSCTVKEFAIYTGLRILLFLGSLALILGVWALLNDGQVHLFFAVALAFLMSGLASYFLLNGPREAFARRVQDRAARTSEAFEERKAREDDD